MRRSKTTSTNNNSSAESELSSTAPATSSTNAESPQHSLEDTSAAAFISPPPQSNPTEARLNQLESKFDNFMSMFTQFMNQQTSVTLESSTSQRHSIAKSNLSSHNHSASSSAPPQSDEDSGQMDNDDDEEDEMTNQEQELRMVPDSPSLSSQIQMMSMFREEFRHSLSTAKLAIPNLQSVSKSAIQSFFDKYKDYHRRGGDLSMSGCLSQETLEIISSQLGLIADEVLEYEDSIMETTLLKLFKSYSIRETQQRLSSIKLSSTSLIHFETFVKKFQFEVSTCSEAPIPQKEMAKIFSNNLGNSAVSESVNMSQPKTLKDAIAAARQHFSTLHQMESMAAAYGVPFNRPKPSVQSGNNHQQVKKYPQSPVGGGYSTPSKPNDPNRLCETCFRPGHNAAGCRTRPENRLTFQEGLKLKREKQQKNNAPSPAPPTTPRPQVPKPPGSATPLTPASSRRPQAKPIQLGTIAEGEEIIPPEDESQTLIVEIFPSEDDFMFTNTVKINTIERPKVVRVPGKLMSIRSDVSEEGVECSVLFDGGASDNIISPKIFNKLEGINFKDITLSMKIADGQEPKQVSTKRGICLLELSLEGVPVMVKQEFTVLETGEDVLLSHSTLESLGLYAYLADPVEWKLRNVPMAPEEASEEDFSSFELPSNPESTPEFCVDEGFPLKSELNTLLEEFEDIFLPMDTNSFIDIDPIVINIKPGSEFKKFPVRRLNPKFHNGIAEEINNLLELGFIIPCESPMVSPIVPVAKPDGSVRLCIDYRVGLNSILELVQYPIPYIPDIIMKFKGMKYFITLDLERGFHQLRISEESQYLTAFICPFGTFKWTRCPFGIANAPSWFQKAVNDIIDPFNTPYVAAFFDDIAIAGESAEAILRNTREVFMKIRCAGARIKKKKSKFGFTLINYIGYQISGNGISLSTERKEKIISIPPPNTLKKLRVFLGMVNYFHKFIPNFATLCRPLYDVAHIFRWGAPQAEAFDAVKTAVSNTTLLHHLDYDLPIVLKTDASNTGVGGVLINISEEGEEKIVIWLSTTFSDAATRWSTIEQEAYAILYCLTTLEPLLAGVSFRLETDHRNLCWLQKALAPKLIRWSLRLQQFNFTIVHIPGVNNKAADQLSRVTSINNILLNDLPCLEDVSTIFDRFHNATVGHLGARTTCKRIKKAGYSWVDMKDDISRLIKECITCQKRSNAEDARSPLLQHRRVEEPFACVALDTIGPMPISENKNKYIITCICEFTKYVILFSTPGATADDALKALLHISGRFGVIYEIMTDQGPQFKNELIEKYCEFWKIGQRFSLPYRPQANGIVERANQEVLRHLRSIVFEKRVKNKWDTYLPLVERIINSSFHSSIGTAPIRMLYGDAITIDRGLLTAWNKKELINNNNNFITSSQYVQQLNQQLDDICSASMSYLAKFYNINNNKNSKNNNIKNFQVGSYVLVSYPGRTPTKLTPKWRGPMLVIGKDKNTYSLLDILTNKPLEMDISRLSSFVPSSRVSADNKLAMEEANLLDRDEFVVQAIIDHHPNYTKKKSEYQFKIRWLGYSPDEDSWLPYAACRDLEALDDYSVANPGLKI